MVPIPGASSSAAPQSKWIEGLSPELPFAEALELILRQRWEGLQHCASQALDRAQEDTEHVHRLRVACRRLTAVLQTLGHELSRKASGGVLKLLKRIRRRCGDARDLDVQLSFVEGVLPHLPAEATAGVGVIREQLLRRRAKAQKKLSSRLARLIEKLEKAGSRLFRAVERNRDETSTEQTFGSACVEMLSGELNRLWERAGDQSPDADTLHELRIACKNLRYAAEVSAPVLHDAFREEFYPQLQKIQDQLGTWNDSLTAEKSLDFLHKKCRRRCDVHEQCELPGSEPIAWRELKGAFAALREAHHQKGEQALQGFRQTWPEFSGRSFRRPVEDLLTSVREEEALRRVAQGAAADREPVGV